MHRFNLGCVCLSPATTTEVALEASPRLVYFVRSLFGYPLTPVWPTSPVWKVSWSSHNFTKQQQQRSSAIACQAEFTTITTIKSPTHITLEMPPPPPVTFTMYPLNLRPILFPAHTGLWIHLLSSPHRWVRCIQGKPLSHPFLRPWIHLLLHQHTQQHQRRIRDLRDLPQQRRQQPQLSLHQTVLQETNCSD